jgi:hypothetical protein
LANPTGKRLPLEFPHHEAAARNRRPAVAVAYLAQAEEKMTYELDARFDLDGLSRVSVRAGV